MALSDDVATKDLDLVQPLWPLMLGPSIQFIVWWRFPLEPT
jgi:hypothetical protein